MIEDGLLYSYLLTNLEFFKITLKHRYCLKYMESHEITQKIRNLDLFNIYDYEYEENFNQADLLF